MTPAPGSERVTPERLAQILALVGAQHYTIDMYAFTVIDVAEDLRDSRAEAASLRADVARLTSERYALADSLRHVLGDHDPAWDDYPVIYNQELRAEQLLASIRTALSPEVKP